MEPMPVDRRTFVGDLVTLGAVPVALLAVHLLVPAAHKTQLAIHFGRSGLTSIWTATLVHHGMAHLTGNLLVYLVTTIPGYLLYTRLGRRRRFWAILLFVGLTTPPVTTAVDYQLWYRQLGVVATGSEAFGFSNVASALGGVLAAGTVAYVRDSFGVSAGGTALSTVLLTVATGVAVSAGAMTPLVVAALAVGWGVTAWQARRALRDRPVAVRSVETLTLAYAFCVIGVVATVLVPADPVDGELFVNPVAHVVGFAWGCVAAAGISLVGSRVH